MSRKMSLTRRIGAIGAGLALGVGLSIAAVTPANAATCSSLGSDWNRVVGSCTGYPSFTVNWTCWGDPNTHSQTFNTSPSLPGYSFNFEACWAVGVTGVWVS